MRSVSARDVLNTPMREGNDATAETVGEYLTILLDTLWVEDEGFSGKRPFGNSSWKYEVYESLIDAGILEGTLDEDGYIKEFNREEAHTLLRWAIMRMWTPTADTSEPDCQSCDGPCRDESDE